MASLLQTFTRDKSSGRAERFINNITGESISGRQYYKIKNGGLSKEKIAKLNRATDELTQLARPARGRKSVLKATPEVKEKVVKERQQKRVVKERNEKLGKEQNKINKKVEVAKAKKVYVKKVRNQLLKPGKQAVRIAFNTYADYLDLLKQAKENGNIFLYGLGYDAIDKRTGDRSPVTVFTMRDLGSPITRQTFDADMQDSITSKSYLEFISYWMHLHFKIEYSRTKAEKAGIKRKWNK